MTSTKLMDRIKKRLETIEKHKDEGYYARAYREDVTELLATIEAARREDAGRSEGEELKCCP